MGAALADLPNLADRLDEGAALAVHLQSRGEHLLLGAHAHALKAASAGGVGDVIGVSRHGGDLLGLLSDKIITLFLYIVNPLYGTINNI